MFGAWRQLRVIGEHSSSDNVFHVTSVLFTLLSRKWNTAPKTGLRGDVSWRVGRNVFQAIRRTAVHVKAVGLNGICYIHGICPCNKKIKNPKRIKLRDVL